MNRDDLMLAVLGVWFLCILLSFLRAHRNHSIKFDAFDLVMENGRVSKIALAFMLVLCVSSWVIVDQQIKGKLTETMFGLWLTAWVTPLVTKVVWNKGTPAEPDKV